MKGPLALAATMSLLVVTLALMGVWWRETPSEPAPARSDAPAADPDGGESEFQDYVARGRKLGEEPASWRGTVPDGAAAGGAQTQATPSALLPFNWRAS